MNHPHAFNHQTCITLFQRFMGKLCPLSLIRGSESYAKLQHTHLIHFHLENIVPSSSHHSPRNASTRKPSKTLLD
jgi:hypothetical protein